MRNVFCKPWICTAKVLLSCSALSLVIAACENKSATEDKASLAQKPVTSGEMSAHVSVSAESNFYQWVNQAWLEKTAIPDDKPGINNFLLMSDEVSEDIQKLLSELNDNKNPGPLERKLSLIYQSYIDLSSRDKIGLRPIKEDLDAIDKAQTLSDVSALFSKLQLIGVSMPFNAIVDADYKQSDRHIIIIGQGGLMLEKDNYLGEDDRAKKIRAQYRELLKRLFSSASDKEADKKAGRVMQIETELAKIQWSKIENRDLAKMYNLSDYNGFKKLLANVDVARHFKEFGLPDNFPVNIQQKSYFEAFNDYFKRVDVDTWKVYLKARLLLSYSRLLGNGFKRALVDYEIARGFYIKEKPIAEQAVRFLNYSPVGLLLGKVYVNKNFNPEIKGKVSEIIHNIVEEYRVAINASARMTAQTRVKALEKLDNMKFKIGYPDKWLDYSKLEVDAHSIAQNYKNISRFETRRTIAKLGQPIDENDWGMAPQVVNAYYNPSRNTFVLLAGILHAPFFDKDGSDSELYGALGFVVGHEIGHGFDDQGSRFDAQGNMKNWWSEEDKQAYDKLKNSLIEAANRYQILPGKFLNGKLEIGEIMGDASGAEIAFRALQKINKAKHVDASEGNKVFFKQLAKTWRSKLRTDIQLMLLERDPHPPSEFRANGIVKNFDEFHTAFNTKAGDAMYLPPQQRIKIW